MKRLALLAVGVAALLAGCSAEDTVADADSAGTTSSAQPAARIGVGDELGWSLYNHDRFLAGDGMTYGPVYASHE
jgi:hypothetical protein